MNIKLFRGFRREANDCLWAYIEYDGYDFDTLAKIVGEELDGGNEELFKRYLGYFYEHCKDTHMATYDDDSTYYYKCLQYDLEYFAEFAVDMHSFKQGPIRRRFDGCMCCANWDGVYTMLWNYATIQEFCDFISHYTTTRFYDLVETALYYLANDI